MCTLFIIGNGFDRAHGLKTSYWDFRNYLEKYAEEFLVQLEKMYDIEPFEKLDKRFKKNREIQKRRNDAVYNALWKQFEYALGEANEAEMMDFSSSIVEDLYLDGGPIGIKDTMDDYWEEQYRFIEELNNYVAKWIRQVRLHKALAIKTSFMNNTEDYFFTFNYTSVLERIYHIPRAQILHIHGGLSPYCDQAPVLGHGNTEKIEHYQIKAEEASDEYDEGEESIYNAIVNFYKRTWKDTSRCMAYNNLFFGKLSGVDKVEVIGHSFGDVDIPYFRSLKHSIAGKADWKLYCHSAGDVDAAKRLVETLKINEMNYEILESSDFWK